MAAKDEGGSVGFWFDTDGKSAPEADSALLKAIEGSMVQRSFAPDEVIFSEGESGDAAYVIKAGVVQVLSRGPDGTAVMLNVLKPGAMFGEMALISGGRRTATVKAFEETTCYVIEKAQFDRMMANVDPWARALILLLVYKLRSISRLVALSTVQY